jgi:hypothetical protein
MPRHRPFRNSRLTWRTALGWLPALALLAACASDPERDMRRYQEQVAKLVPALDAQGDVDSLAAASLFGGRDAAERNLDRITRTTSVAPDRADLAWLHLSLCREVPSCDPAPLEARLLTLAPTNGAAWFGPIERATRADDNVELQHSLNAFAQSEHVDLYWAPLAGKLTLAIGRTHQWPNTQPLISVIGLLAAHAVPPFQSISHACKDAALEQPERLSACRGAARALIHSDTYLTEMIGLGIGKRVWDVGSHEGSVVLAAERLERYRMEAWSKLSNRSLWSDRWTRQYLADLEAYSNEQDMARAQLRRAGIPTDPPADAAGVSR